LTRMTINLTTRKTIARGIKTRHRQDMKLVRANQTKIQKLTKAARAARIADKPAHKATKSDKTRKTIVIAHRGGNFGPENSMKNFRKAILNKVEGVEFDVWLSKDNVPMVLHGGGDGQLSQYGRPNDFVFDVTSKSLRQFDIGEGETIPTLAEVLQLLKQAPEMLINIEIKAPFETPAVFDLYNYKRACQIIKEHIDRYQVGEQTIISSFCSSVTRQMRIIAPIRSF